MLRMVIVLAAFAATPAVAELTVQKPGASVDLGRPGALEALQRDNPTQYRRVTDVLRAAAHPPCRSEELERMRASLEVRDLHCSFQLLTSFPPKRQLSFVVGDVRYHATVTMAHDPGRVIRALQTR